MKKISKIDMNRQKAKIELLVNELNSCYVNFTKKHGQFLEGEDSMWVDFPTFAISIALFSKYILESHPVDDPNFEKEIKDKFMEVMNIYLYNEVDISE